VAPAPSSISANQNSELPLPVNGNEPLSDGFWVGCGDCGGTVEPSGPAGTLVDVEPAMLAGTVIVDVVDAEVFVVDEELDAVTPSNVVDVVRWLVSPSVVVVLGTVVVDGLVDVVLVLLVDVVGAVVEVLVLVDIDVEVLVDVVLVSWATVDVVVAVGTVDDVVEVLVDVLVLVLVDDVVLVDVLVLVEEVLVVEVVEVDELVDVDVDVDELELLDDDDVVTSRFSHAQNTFDSNACGLPFHIAVKRAKKLPAHL
jgi:hypothetical protein